MMPAKLKLLTSRTLLSLKMMLAKLPLPILKTSQSLKMMVARLTLLLSMPELMLRLLPETVRTRPSMTESIRRYPTVNLLSLTCKIGLTPRMMRGLQTFLISRLRINKEISDRESAIADLQNRSDSQNDERIADISDLKTKMMQENAFLKSLNGKTLGVYFNAYRTKAYDGGGEENLTFQGTYCNVGGGLDTDTGIFTCPTGGTYMFQFHIATHDNKKALLSIRKNGEEIASIFDQNHKDNHKNSMAGQNIIMDVKRGDEIVVYAYTGTWLADFPMNHYTHWVGLLLEPSEEEIESLRKAAEEV